MKTINKDSMVFQFMLKEYEKLYGKFDMHYQAVEKSINFYFILIGAVISLNGLVYNKTDKIEVFNLSGLQSIFLLILCILGFLIYFKVIEHRLLIIAYVKSLNLNRKWFLDNSEDFELKKYLYFNPDVSEPKFYKKYRHFYWEAAGLATINSIFCSLFVINCVIKINFFVAKEATIVNSIWMLICSLLFTKVHMFYYKKKGIKEEKNISKKFGYQLDDTDKTNNKKEK